MQVSQVRAHVEVSNLLPGGVCNLFSQPATVLIFQPVLKGIEHPHIVII